MNPADAMQAAQAPVADMTLLGLFLQAHFVVKLVMLGLLGASIWCWSIIVDKTLLFRRTKAEMDAFEDAFWSGRSLEELYRSFVHYFSTRAFRPSEHQPNTRPSAKSSSTPTTAAQAGLSTPRTTRRYWARPRSAAAPTAP